MATGHFYLTSGSPGAPSLSTTVGSLIAVLDWALAVAGAVYWEKVFSGTNLAVYRSKTGNRNYLRVNDAGAETAVVRMFTSMSDVSTGLEPSPNGGNQSTSYARVPRADEAGGHSYHIVGDDRFFIMLISPDTAYGNWNSVLAFGDFNSYNPLDGYNTVLISSAYATDDAAYATRKLNFLSQGNSQGYFQNATYAQTADNPGVFCIKSPDGVIASTACMIHNPFGILRGSSTNSIGSPGMCRMDTSPTLVYQPFYIMDSNGAAGALCENLFAAKGAGTYVRGVIPYIYATPYAGGSGAAGNFTDGVSTFVQLATFGDGATPVSALENSFVHLLRSTNDEPGRA